MINDNYSLSFRYSSPAFSLSPDEKKFRLLEAAEIHPKSKDSEKTTSIGEGGGGGSGTEITPCTHCKKLWAAEHPHPSNSSTTPTPKVEGECCCSAKHRTLTPHEQTILQVADCGEI